MTSAAQDPFDFNLFLSYSRRADYRLSRRVESFLESFHKRVPARSRGQLSPLQICVDGSDFKLPPHSTDAGGGREVPDVIVANLGRSRELLVLCSASAAASSWVTQEIEWFVQHRGRGSIRLALTEGDDPTADPERYFGAVLRANGLDRNIWYDFRGFNPKQTKHVVASFERELVRLASDLNGMAAGEIYPLWLEEERRKVRRTAVWTVLAVSLIAAGLGVGYTENARRRVAQAQEQTARAEAAKTELARQAEEQRRKTEEEKRKVADANARAEQAQRLVSDAFERLYRAPAEAVSLADTSRALLPSPTSDRALADAYRVAIFRHENRRQARRLTGSGPGYLASRWSTSNLTSVVSANGRYVVVITPRGQDGVTGPDGKPLPGELYLMDNETLRPLQLQNCRDDDGLRRIEYVGFDGAIRELIVTRHYNLMTYSLTGDCLQTAKLECCTKSPIHLVEGYFAGTYLVAADTKGGLWLVDRRTGRIVEVRSEWARDTVTAIVISADQSRAVVISESGRATLLTINRASRPTELEIARREVRAAAFHPQRSNVLVIAGLDGLAQLWETGAGRAVLRETFSLPRVTIDSVAFTSDERMVATSDDRRLYVLEAGVTQPVATLQYPIDWAASRSVPNHRAEWRPEMFRALKEAGDSIPFPNPQMAVDRVQTIDGRTWVFSVRNPENYVHEGPAYVIEGNTAKALPDRNTNVSRVEARGGSTWLHASKGLYQLTAKGLRLALPPGTSVRVTAEIQGALWFGTNHGAWRIQGDSVARFTPPNLQISAITEIGGKLWFTATDGVFRLDAPDRLLRVTDEGLSARRVVVVRDQIWILTGSESEPGPALRVHDLWTKPLPAAVSRVTDVLAAHGTTWLLSPDGLFRVDGEILTPIVGLSDVVAVKEAGGSVIALQRTFLGAGPAYLITGNRATRLIPDAGVTQVVNIGKAVYLLTAGREQLTAGPLYRLRGRDAVLVTAGDSHVASLRSFEGQLWVTLDSWIGGPTARLERDRIVPLRADEKGFAPGAMTTVAGIQWLTGDGGACLIAAQARRCFETPSLRVVGVRRVQDRWWLLTQDGFNAGPPYRIEGDVAKLVTDERKSVSDVQEISGATWLVLRQKGRPAPLERVN